LNYKYLKLGESYRLIFVHSGEVGILCYITLECAISGSMILEL